MPADVWVQEAKDRSEANIMRDRQLPMADAKYRPLKSFVATRGGLRLALHGGLRDRLVEIIVEEWPPACPIEHLDEVVRAKVGRRVRERYSGVLATFVLSVLVNALVRLVIEWWFDKPAHRVLMQGWSRAAQDSDV